MKRFLILLVTAVLIAAAGPARAAEPTAGVYGMARFIPANAVLFVSLRIDDALIAQFDGLVARIYGLIDELGAPVDDVPDTRRAVAMLLGMPSTDQIDTMLGFAGDFVSIAVSQREEARPPAILVAATLDDMEAARTFVLESAAPGAVSLGLMGRFDVYDLGADNFVLFADDLLLAVSNVTFIELAALASETYPRLSGVTQYVQSVGALPAASYDFGLYVESAALRNSPLANLAAGVSLAAGATALDGSTYAIDLAAVSPQPAMAPLTINPDFARNIPATMGAVIHGADLATLINTALDRAEAAGEGQPRQAIAAGFALLGQDFNTFLSWTKGDYALFGRLDARPILSSILGIPPNLRSVPDVLDFGLVIEAVNPASARAFAAGLANFVRSAASQGAQGLSVSEETISGVPLTVVAVDTELGSGVRVFFEFALGASDEVFALGTASAVRAVFGGAAGLPDSPTYAAAAQYWLPDPTTVWTLDGLTAANFGAFVALLAVPVNSNDPRPDAAQVSQIISRVGEVVHFATISTSVDDAGATLLRASIRLAP